MPIAFLTAQWRDIIIASYAVADDVLTPLLPPGLELDRFQGHAVCSLVGFRFLNTRVAGVRWPGHSDFPEINLRFYVREPGRGGLAPKRGVVFIREIVRSPFIAAVARLLYNEPYVKGSITDSTTRNAASVDVSYSFACGAGRGEMSVEADPGTWQPGQHTPEHWFKEHKWGYGVGRSGRTFRYEVQHPMWACRKVRSHSIDVDWDGLYGERWRPLIERKPISVVLALGSPIKVMVARSRVYTSSNEPPVNEQVDPT